MAASSQKEIEEGLKECGISLINLPSSTEELISLLDGESDQPGHGASKSQAKRAVDDSFKTQIKNDSEELSHNATYDGKVGPSLPGSSKLPTNDDSGRDSPGAITKKKVSQPSLLASDEFAAAEALKALGSVSISKNSNVPETSRRPRKRKNFLSQEEGKATDDVCSERVDVHGYRVLACSAPILAAIFAKYGDIAVKCHSKSPYTRALFLDVACDAVRELRTGSVRFSSIRAMKDFVSVAEDANVDITWLQQYLNEISEDEEMEKTRRAKFLDSLFPTSSS